MLAHNLLHIHKYQRRQDSIKTLYDDYADLKIVSTGSSVLKLKSAADRFGHPGCRYLFAVGNVNRIPLRIFGFLY